MNSGEKRLVAQQYGKQGIRIVTVQRGERHELTDLEVAVTLTGSFDRTYETGDNTGILPTDSQKNTVYAFAREHGAQPVTAFAVRLARHFVDSQPLVRAARITVRERMWASAGPGHSFVGADAAERIVHAVCDGPDRLLVEGVEGLRLLNTTGSEFRGFARDAYTTLPEAADRIMATVVSARWRYRDAAPRQEAFQQARQALVDAYAGTYSRSLQQTLYAMGENVLDVCDDLVEVRLALPYLHHHLVDLAPFELDNPAQVYRFEREPFGLIEGTLVREDAPYAGRLWW